MNGDAFCSCYTHAGDSVGMMISVVCICLCVCVCPLSKSKTTRAINTKLGTRIGLVHDSR